MSALSRVSLIAAITTASLYWVLNYTSIPQSFKWYLFGAHLLAAAIGASCGLLSLLSKPWPSVVGLVICVYFLVLQLG